MEDRLHVVEGAELGKADFLQALAHHGDVRAKVFGLVRVAADGEDTAAEVVVEAQDLNAGGEIGQAVSDGGGVELDALVARIASSRISATMSRMFTSGQGPSGS